MPIPVEGNKREDVVFPIQLTVELEGFLYDTNPWWRGKSMRPVPPFRRWLFEHILQRLQRGLTPVTVVRGPRQVGKTTLQHQIIEHLLYQERVNPNRIFRVQFDEIPSLMDLTDPILSLCRWFESRVLSGTFNEWARKGEPIYLFLDEVRNLQNRAPQLKAPVDHHAIRVFLTGSSALRIEYGRDSLAGRISTLELGSLLLSEIAELRLAEKLPPPLLPLNGLKQLTQRAFWLELQQRGLAYREVRDKAFAAFSERGGYPVAQARADLPWEEIADPLNETIICRVIRHDLRLGERGRRRDENLLEELLRVCCRYAGLSPSHAVFIQELRQALSANIRWHRVLAYLRFLNDTLLIRLINLLDLRLKRRKGNRKICLCDPLAARKLAAGSSAP